MARLECELVSIYAPESEAKAVLRRLQELAVMDIDTAASDDATNTCPEGFEKHDTSVSTGAYERNLALAESALKILNARFPEKKGLLASLNAPPAVSSDDFYLKREAVQNAVTLADDVVENERVIAEQKAEALRLETSARQMSIWNGLDVPLSFSGTPSTAAFVGTLAGVYTLEGLLAALAERAPQLEPYVEIVNTDRDSTYIFLCCPRRSRRIAEDVLRELSFARPFQITSKLPRDKIASKDERRAACEQKAEEALAFIREAADKRRDLEIFADFCRAKADGYRVLGETDHTRHTVLIRGYVAKTDMEYLRKHLEADFSVVIEAESADKGLAPVKLKNNSFFTPAQSLVKMYSLPSEHDIDPTPLTGFFYYLFFGMMFSDAGYGLLMILATTLVLKKLRPSPSMRQNMRLFRYCGISTFLWGLVYGSFFGDIIAVVSETYFGHRVALPALIDPMNGDAVTMLILSVGLGFAEIIAGLCAKFATCMKNGDKAGAFFDAGLWITTLCGIAVMALGFVAFAPLKTVGIALALASVVGLILTQGRDKKNPILRIFSGITSLYDITGYVSDLLSFSRLMALGLTTAAMGAVFNMLSTMGGKTVFGFIMLIIIFPVGHAINFGLNVLGAYVHTLRLQYVELFSKFYEGGGRDFNAFSFKSKYVGLNGDNIKEDI